MQENPKNSPQQRKPRRNSTVSSEAASAPEGGGGFSHVAERAASDVLRRVPPHALEAEQAVLGGIFLRNSVLHSIADILIPDDFYLPAHQTLFSACLELYSKNVPIDLTTIAGHLRETSRLESIGGAIYLADLAQGVVSAANAEYHANIVREKAILRGLITAGADIIRDSFEAGVEVQSVLDEAEQRVFSVSRRVGNKQFQTPNDLLAKLFDDLAKRAHKGDMVTGVSTGYADLDRSTAGLQPSDLVIVAARPSMGKTAFALNMCMRSALQRGTPVAVFSLEMSTEQLVMRMLCSLARVDLSKLRKAELDDDDWQRLSLASDSLSATPIYIDDTAALTTLELRARTRRLKAEKQIGLIMIDYLQLMRSSRRVDSRELEISDISRSLKALAKELKIPVIALAQLNRKVEERSNKRPMLSDLRESGAIEQDADVIMFIYRDDVYNKSEDNPRKGVAEIIIGKQRNGPTGVVELAYMSPYTSFEELTYRPPPPEGGYDFG